jgi:hypothetical protein
MHHGDGEKEIAEESESGAAFSLLMMIVMVESGKLMVDGEWCRSSIPITNSSSSRLD